MAANVGPFSRLAHILEPAEGTAAQKVVTRGAAALNETEAAAVVAYVRSAGPINDVLRARGEVSSMVRDIDRAIKKGGPLSRDIVVWRGLKAPLTTGARDVQQFRDLGFVSTTVDRKIAEKFSTSAVHGLNLVRITAPKGTDALWVKKAARSSGQKEVLLPRGLTFRVVRKRIMPVAQYEAEFGKLSVRSGANAVSTVTVTDVEVVAVP